MPNIIEITEFHAPELDPYARLTQNQLRNRLEPEKGIFIAESPKVIDRALCGAVVHTSFQIRLPYIQGMVHQVDFQEILDLCGQTVIRDSWGQEHHVKDVDIILTKSMFKGFGWLKDSGMTWADYWDAFRRYRHALYLRLSN